MWLFVISIIYHALCTVVFILLTLLQELMSYFRYSSSYCRSQFLIFIISPAYPCYPLNIAYSTHRNPWASFLLFVIHTALFFPFVITCRTVFLCFPLLSHFSKIFFPLIPYCLLFYSLLYFPFLLSYIILSCFPSFLSSVFFNYSPLFSPLAFLFLILLSFLFLDCLLLLSPCRSTEHTAYCILYIYCM